MIFRFVLYKSVHSKTTYHKIHLDRLFCRMALIASRATEPLQHNLNSCQQAKVVLNDLIGRMLGVYRTEEVLED